MKVFLSGCDHYFLSSLQKRHDEACKVGGIGGFHEYFEDEVLDLAEAWGLKVPKS